MAEESLGECRGTSHGVRAGKTGLEWGTQNLLPFGKNGSLIPPVLTPG